MSQEHCAGDFNGNAIWENIIKPIIQNDSLHEINNDNKICEFSHIKYFNS